MTMWYGKSVDETLKELGTSKEGLSESEAKGRLEKYGRNQLEEKKPKSPFVVFLEQFKSFLVIILLIATVISLALGELVDAAVIAVILVLNAALGFYQEKKAEKALEALKKMTVPKSKVVRNGKHRIVESFDIVPGDVVVLETGDRIPADCRVVDEINLKVNESVLTGESSPVSKTFETLSNDNLPVAEQKNILFAGTTVVYGHCIAVVASTGMGTEFGKIAKMLQVPEEETPLQEKLDVLGKQMGMIVLGICGLIFFVGYIQGADILEMFIVAVALAVAAVPEGLPASITIALSLGVHRMSKRNAIVRRLASVETLGSTTVICSDKTGTLTMNEMTVRKIFVDDKIFNVTGEGYSFEGKFMLEGKETDVSKHGGLKLLLKTGMMCNDAKMDGSFVGDPTELSLLVSAKKGNIDDIRTKHERIEEIPFDSARKMMSAAYLTDGKKDMYVKGAPESVLSKCSRIHVDGRTREMTQNDRKRIMETNENFARNALRVLAFAFKEVPRSEKMEENELVFIGLQGMIDPPRPEVKQAIELCKSAGIKVVIITGDHRDTAMAIGRELSIVDGTGKVITGAELDEMSDEEFKRTVEDVSVYARAAPEHKVRITNALKARGHVVAMTGDGVNDAPALKQSDIGIAMGITGTDVTKEASDMILADDNFSTIVSAVEEGRGIYDNIRKVVAFLLSGNIAEVAIVALAIFVGLSQNAGMGLLLPLTAIQILWINLVTDGLPALALSMDPIDRDVMKKKPRPKNESVWSGLRPWLVDTPVIMTILTFLLFSWGMQESLLKAQTLTFTAIIAFEKYIAFSCRSLDRPVGRKILNNKLLNIATVLTLALHLLILYVPALSSIFGVVPLSVYDWLVILATGSVAFLYLETYKWFRVRSGVLI